jgi:hypothetical protein
VVEVRGAPAPSLETTTPKDRWFRGSQARTSTTVLGGPKVDL